MSGSLLLAGASFIPSDAAYAAGNYARVSVHDPSVVRTEDGGYFIIGSHLGAAKSDDMMNWHSAANSDRGSTNTTFFGDIYKELAIPAMYGVNGSETTHMTEQGKANGDVIGGGDGITNMDALEIQKFMLDLVDSPEIGG